MNDVVIRAEGLGKRYRIGRRGPQTTLRESITGLMAAAGAAFKPSRATPPREGAPSDDFWALEDLSFELSRGEVLGVIGRNGAGKSTLLKILSRITEPTTGMLELVGRVGSLLEVGTGFHSELTGRENIYLNGAILGMKRAEITERFDAIVEFADVTRFLDTAVKHYSSGMYARLAFAVAAHLEPEILVVDEVLAVGDAEFQRRCMGKMSEVAKQGRTVLFVSHNMSAIQSLCTRGLWLERGRYRGDGPILPLIQAYASSGLNNAHHDLDKIPGRTTGGRIHFTKYWLESPRGTVVQEATSGAEVHVVMEYQTTTPTVRDCRVSIAVESLMGQPLFVCATDLTIRDEIRLGGRGTVACTIPRFPLTAGEYALTLALDAGRQVEDVVQSSARISVIDGDFFGSGRQCPPGWEQRCVIIPHSWMVDRPAEELSTD